MTARHDLGSVWLFPAENLVNWKVERKAGKRFRVRLRKRPDAQGRGRGARAPYHDLGMRGVCGHDRHLRGRLHRPNLHMARNDQPDDRRHH